MRFFLLMMLFTPLSTFAQSISGKITDHKGKAIPYASIYVKGSTLGTSANNDGEYTLTPGPGTYEIIFSALGYKQSVHFINVSATSVIQNPSLSPEVYSLPDVVISAGGEDPSNQIIRNAIRNRKEHLNEVEAYNVDVYIKGMEQLLEAPKKFLGKDVGKVTRSMGLDSNRQGILYLSESQSVLSYKRPNRYREQMIASKVSGSNRGYSFNRAADLQMNFYHNYINWEGLSTRPLISPIADNAFFYYRYELLGTSVQDGRMINKIRVIPRRNNDPVFRGEIYILEDSWHIHAVDLSLTKEAGINLVDNLKITQSFNPVNDKAWMPSSVKVDFTGHFFGFRYKGYYLAAYNNYDFSQPLSKKKDFAESLRITADVSKKDSIYWQAVRPIPLTQAEQIDYRKKDAFAIKRESKQYIDSLDQEHNQFKPFAFIFGSGYDHKNTSKRDNYRFGSLLESVFFNSIEGWGFNYSSSYTKSVDRISDKQLQLTGTVRYGFKSSEFHAHANGSFPYKNTKIAIRAGSDIADLNNFGTISRLENTLYSLLFSKNYPMLYEKTFAGITVAGRLHGGLRATASLDWTDRESLLRSIDHRKRNHSVPDHQIMNFPKNQSLITQVSLSYDFSNRYITLPTGKSYLDSKYPILGITYTRGINKVLRSDVNYGLWEVEMSKSDIRLGFFGKVGFNLVAGKFFNNSLLYFTDRRHFSGNQTLILESKANGFLLLPYYEYSTDQKFLEGHAEYNFTGFILHNVPVLRSLKLQEIVAFHYLATPKMSNYQEIAFGVEHPIGLKVLHATSFTLGKRAQAGIKIAYSLTR